MKYLKKWKNKNRQSHTYTLLKDVVISTLKAFAELKRLQSHILLVILPLILILYIFARKISILLSTTVSWKSSQER